MSLSCTFHNLRRASRVVTQLYDGYFDEVGLKATQFTALAALAWYDEKAPTVGELADTLVLEQSSLSRNLSVLERLGFVRLVPGEEDRRERIVTLTRAGRVALARGFPMWRKAQAAIGAALESGELDSQLVSLRRLTEVAQQLRSARWRPRDSQVAPKDATTVRDRGPRDRDRDRAPHAARSSPRAQERAQELVPGPPAPDGLGRPDGSSERAPREPERGRSRAARASERA